MTTARTRRLGTALAALLLLVVLAACGQPAQNSSSTSAPAAGGKPLVPVLAVSELVRGPNRIALAVLRDGTPLNSPDLKLGLRFFYLDGSEDTTVQGTSAAVYRGQGLPFGLYVGYATFDKPGNWSVEISIPTGGEPQVVNIRLDVKAESRVPTIGQPALPSHNLTAADSPDLTKITSDAKPDPDFYQLTIADAIAAKKPFVIGFLTPGYCKTAVCAPNMAVLKKLKDEYKDKVNFIHVEVYPYPYGEAAQTQTRVEAMIEWNLLTEPWTFLVDANGIIQYRYEGGITFDEMQLAIAQLAAGEPVTPLSN